MANLLFLVHRMPYPPNKGDKVRSYHLLKHLAARHRVFLGTFIDDPEDEAHLPALHALCAGLCALPLQPRLAKLRSLRGLAHGEPLSLRYYADRGLRDWVVSTLAREEIDAVIVFSSAMAQYTDGIGDTPLLVDLVDVDSAKWTEYADAHAWPMSWLYRREGQRLLAYERATVARANLSFLVTDKETALFQRLAPEAGGKVLTLGNGVDAHYFSPAPDRVSPFASDALPIVFTGAMDYWPNIDAVRWFVTEVLPLLHQRAPRLKLHIVGRSPTPAVLALAGDSVVVTGTVPDIRPYLQFAAVVVAPLRLARGVQNKVLEAMAMARPVVAATSCVQAIECQPGNHVLSADEAVEFAVQILSLLDDPGLATRVGTAGRAFVLDCCSWPARLARLDHELERLLAGRVDTEAIAA